MSLLATTGHPHGSDLNDSYRPRNRQTSINRCGRTSPVGSVRLAQPMNVGPLPISRPTSCLSSAWAAILPGTRPTGHSEPSSEWTPLPSLRRTLAVAVGRGIIAGDVRRMGGPSPIPFRHEPAVCDCTRSIDDAATIRMPLLCVALCGGRCRGLAVEQGRRCAQPLNRPAAAFLRSTGRSRSIPPRPMRSWPPCRSSRPTTPGTRMSRLAAAPELAEHHRLDRRRQAAPLATATWASSSCRPTRSGATVKLMDYAGESDKGPFPVPPICRSKAGRSTTRRQATLDDVQRDRLREGGDRHAHRRRSGERACSTSSTRSKRPTAAGRPPRPRSST